MMKRFINILIAGLFLFTTTGFTITKHYCSGNLVDIAIDSTPKSCCDMGEGCCSNESEFFQLKDDMTAIQSMDLDQSFSFDIQLFLNEFIIINSNEVLSFVSYFKNDLGPPDLSVFLAQIQSFRL